MAFMTLKTVFSEIKKSFLTWQFCFFFLNHLFVTWTKSQIWDHWCQEKVSKGVGVTNSNVFIKIHYDLTGSDQGFSQKIYINLISVIFDVLFVDTRHKLDTFRSQDFLCVIKQAYLVNFIVTIGFHDFGSNFVWQEKIKSFFFDFDFLLFRLLVTEFH